MGSALMGGMGVGSGMGLMKYLGDVQGSKNDRALNATMAKWAPMVAAASQQTIKHPRTANLFGSLLQGAGAGGDFMQKNPQALDQVRSMFGGGYGVEGASPVGTAPEDAYGPTAPGSTIGIGANSINPWVAMANGG